MPIPAPPAISLAPMRAYLSKLPFITVLVPGVCVILWALEAVTWLPIREWLKLDPGIMGLSQCKFFFVERAERDRGGGVGWGR